MACGLLLPEHGFHIQPINYLAVPRGRLRIMPPPYHDDAHDDALIGRPAGGFGGCLGSA